MGFFFLDLPQMIAVDQNPSQVVRYRPTLSDLFSETIAKSQPRFTGFVIAPSTTARD
jgi:hypothetical protein